MQPTLIIRGIINLTTGQILQWADNGRPLPDNWEFYDPPCTPWLPCGDCPGLGHCAQAGGCLRLP